MSVQHESLRKVPDVLEWPPARRSLFKTRQTIYAYSTKTLSMQFLAVEASYGSFRKWRALNTDSNTRIPCRRSPKLGPPIHRNSHVYCILSQAIGVVTSKEIPFETRQTIYAYSTKTLSMQFLAVEASYGSFRKWRALNTDSNTRIPCRRSPKLGPPIHRNSHIYCILSQASQVPKY